jgi:hypothetical protein
MTLPLWLTSIPIRTYCVLFMMFAAAKLGALWTDSSPAYIYYHSMMKFYDLTVFWYAMALLDGILAGITCIAVFRAAFSLAPLWPRFFRTIFFLRLATVVMGNNYETVGLKALYINSPSAGILCAVAFVLILLPSFRIMLKNNVRTSSS